MASRDIVRESTGILRVIGYERVSTDEQVLQGVSLDAQRVRLKAHAKAHGYELVGIERDNGVSGKVPPSKREGLRRALDLIRAGNADGIVFLKLYRLSRSVRDILKLADDARRGGWHLMSVSEHIDTSTASGKFTLGVLALLAEMERDQVGERTRIGMAQLALEGRVRSRFLPFGFRVEGASRATSVKAGEKRKLVADRRETQILRRMLRLRKSGKGAHLIAKYLNEDRVGNPRTGKPWTTGTVAAIMRTADRRALLAANKGL